MYGFRFELILETHFSFQRTYYNYISSNTEYFRYACLIQFAANLVVTVTGLGNGLCRCFIKWYLISIKCRQVSYQTILNRVEVGQQRVLLPAFLSTQYSPVRSAAFFSQTYSNAANVWHGIITVSLMKYGKTFFLVECMQTIFVCSDWSSIQFSERITERSNKVEVYI